MKDVGQQLEVRDTIYKMMTQLPKTIDHLLIACPFSWEIWFKVLHKVGWDSVAPNIQSHKFVVWSADVRKQIQKAGRCCFDSLVVLVCWLLRNDRTFDRRVRTIQDVLARVSDEIAAF